MEKFSSYFTGKYLKYWYVAFGITILVFISMMVNNKAVKKYELIIFDKDGKVVDTRTMDRYNWRIPETLPLTKAYRPVKPVGGN